MHRTAVAFLLVTLMVAAGSVWPHSTEAGTTSTPAPAARPPVKEASAVPLRTPEDVLADVRRATARYVDIARAREDGFVQASGMEPNHGYHFVNVPAQLRAAASGLRGELDLARPPMLVYVERDGAWQLAGVEYALPRPPATNPFPGARWHEHEASCHYRDYREVPSARATDCPPRHPESGAEFSLWHPAFAVAHVWAWYPNPDGPFAAENRYLAPYGGAGASAAGPAHHPRSAPDLAYSQWTHRAAGLVLILLAGVMFWESRRSRAFPWSALSAPLWIVFGIYLFCSSDPEAWPWGPGRFTDIFGDMLVLQHKTLALIPIAIGSIHGLRAGGLLARAGWVYLVPILAVAGGGSLLVHFHEGRLHVDSVYLQHVVMGLTAAGLGVALVLARRRPRGDALLRWAWPVFLTALGLLLAFYREG